MSHTFSMNSGSGDNLKDSRRWGFRPKALQMPLTPVWLIPVAWAVERVDQWVAPAGIASRVITMARSTSSSVIERGTTGQSSSW